MKKVFNAFNIFKAMYIFINSTTKCVLARMESKDFTHLKIYKVRIGVLIGIQMILVSKKAWIRLLNLKCAMSKHTFNNMG